MTAATFQVALLPRDLKQLVSKKVVLTIQYSYSVLRPGDILLYLGKERRAVSIDDFFLIRLDMCNNLIRPLKNPA